MVKIAYMYAFQGPDSKSECAAQHAIFDALGELPFFFQLRALLDSMFGM